LQQVFVEFGDSYTLLDVYNISKKLELTHAHYEASTMRLPSHSRPHPSPTMLIKSSHYSLMVKEVHSITPILPSCNYCGNLAHKASECNIPFEDLFCDYCGKIGTSGSCLFYEILRVETTPITMAKFANIFRCPSNQKPRHLSLPFRLSPPKVIPVRMLRRRSTML